MTPHEIMVKAGKEWLAADPNRDPKFSTYGAMPGALFTDNEDADLINDVMVNAAEDAGHIVSPEQFNAAIVVVLTVPAQ